MLFLREYANFIKDDLISQLADLPKNMVLSLDLIPEPTDKAIKEVQKKIMAVETDISRWQTRQNMNNQFSANIPYELEQARSVTKEIMDDITVRDQHMIHGLLTINHLADTEEELDEDTETIRSVAGSHGNCQIGILKWQQEDGLNT